MTATVAIQWSKLITSSVQMRSYFLPGLASMEQAADGAETAAIDGLVLSWSENISVSFCLRAPGYGLTLWCALGLLVGAQYKCLSYSYSYSWSVSQKKYFLKSCTHSGKIFSIKQFTRFWRWSSSEKFHHIPLIKVIQYRQYSCQRTTVQMLHKLCISTGKCHWFDSVVLEKDVCVCFPREDTSLGHSGKYFWRTRCLLYTSPSPRD